MTKQKIKETYSDDVRLALLEQTITNINDTLVRFEKRFDRIEQKMDSNFKWVLGTIFGLGTFLISSLIGLGAIMAHGFHWF